jgi:hypothetical protein
LGLSKAFFKIQKKSLPSLFKANILQTKILRPKPIFNKKSCIIPPSLTYSYIYSKHRLPFICFHLGLLVPSKFFIYKILTKKTSLYKIKKNMHSFLKINEYRMHIFNKKRRLLTRFITSKIKSLNFFKKKLFISNSIFFNYLSLHTKSTYNLYNKSLYNHRHVFLVDKVFNKSDALKDKRALRRRKKKER